jgi:hypothetical protein
MKKLQHAINACLSAIARPAFPVEAAAALALLALATGCGSSSTTATAPSTTSTTTSTPAGTSKSALPSGVPERLRHAYGVYVKLLKAPKNSSLPPSLVGSVTKAAALSPGSQKHDAAGAVLTTNGGALVGLLVFPNHAAAVADLKAFPPDAGPNKIIGTPKGFPKPAYILSAAGNGYTARYVVFVEGGVLVNTWAYGKKGKQSEAVLQKLVEQNARWARARVAAAQAPTKE